MAEVEMLFDRLLKDSFALQDEIVKYVMVELQVELTQGAAARVASRGTDSLDAWLLRIEAQGEFAKFTRDGMYVPANSTKPRIRRILIGRGP